MELYLLDQNFEIKDVIEGYQSAVWTERYDAHGDCVIKYPLKIRRPADFPKKWYIMNSESDDLMIIKSAQVTYDPEEGRALEINAKALTSLLDQRIVWTQTNLDSNLEAAVRRLMNENAISPSNTLRRFTNMTFATSGGTVPSVFTVEAQYQGEKLYDAIHKLCQSYDVGFRITHPSRGQFRFQLYGGYNRSYEQDILPHVVFSPEHDNLSNASYFTSNEEYCNVVLVAGEGNGNKKTFRAVGKSGEERSGVNRFEHYLNAERVSSNDDEIPIAKYRAMLDQQGREYIKDNDIQHVFDGETDPTNSYGYGVDYFLGDIVQVSDEDVIVSPARVVEYIRSDDKGEGKQAFPALRIKNDED